MTRLEHFKKWLLELQLSKNNHNIIIKRFSMVNNVCNNHTLVTLWGYHCFPSYLNILDKICELEDIQMPYYRSNNIKALIHDSFWESICKILDWPITGSLKRYNAAKTIQRYWRGYLVRRTLPLKRIPLMLAIRFRPGTGIEYQKAKQHFYYLNKIVG